METPTEVFKYFISMLSILNPIAALPVFISFTMPYSSKELSKIANNCAFSVLITLLVASILGDNILSFFGIQLPSFQVAGGIIIALTAFSMIRAENAPTKITQDEIDRQSKIREIGIVPLAIPMLAGPGAITTAIIHSYNFKTSKDWISALICLIILSIMIKVIFTFSRKIRDLVGRVSLNVLTRIIGLILMAISVEHISRGIKGLFDL